MYSKKYSVFLYNNGSSRFMKFFSRPFVSLTQAAKIAEKAKNMVVSKDYLLPGTKSFYRRGRREDHGPTSNVQRPTSTS